MNIMNFSFGILSNNQVNLRSTPSIPSKLPPVCDSQASLKAQILAIQGNKSLTPKEKASSMQNLMTSQWKNSQSKKNELETTTNDIQLDRIQPSYHDPEQTQFGCSHYRRGCKLQAACCQKYYTCRFCHDDNEEHQIDRYATANVWCMECGTSQPISNRCINSECSKQFGRYYCDICKFFDDDETKEIYHCEKCKICRIGKGLGVDYFHCDKCNACMSVTLRDHKCVERSLESNCPICNAFMFTSTTPVMFLRCGHCMHVACYEEYTLTNYVCPICSKSLGDMQQYFERIDELLEHEEMPSEYKNFRTHIFCCDCHRKSVAQFHFIYHKCQFNDCKSYNTKILRQFEADNNDIDSGVRSMDLSN